MGFWELYEPIQRWFEKALDENWLYIAVIVIFFLSMGLLIGGGLYVILKSRDNPPAPDPDRVFIEANAPGYCQERGFNTWRYKENTTAPQFECYNAPNESKSIERYLNMSGV